MGENNADNRLPRVPPAQTVTTKWPVLTHGTTPRINEETWEIRMVGAVESPLLFGLKDWRDLPRVRQCGDFHCVTTWSTLDNEWEGVSTGEIAARVRPTGEAQFVLVRSDGEYTANLTLADFLAQGVLLADARNGARLSPAHGWPVRLVVPQLYAWESAKWVRALEFLNEQQLGFWERHGYHRRRDPWREERFATAE